MDKNNNMDEHKKGDSLYYHDAVYGSVNLHPLVKCIVNTPHFQRLRFITQMGVAPFVFPSAVHTRYLHCVGTAILCEKLVKEFQSQSHFGDLLTQQESLCIILAGLCHDLGHGPYSHVFEDFMDGRWSHEKMSVIMFDDMLKKNPYVLKKIRQYGLKDQHLLLIKSLILGAENGQADQCLPEVMVDGKMYKKHFLLEIVCNNLNGVDLDKIDYLVRDSHFLGIDCRFDYERLIKSLSLGFYDSELHVCFKERVFLQINELFHTRWLYTIEYYKNPKVRVYGMMFVKIFSAIDKILKISDNCYNPNFFVNLTEDYITGLLRSGLEVYSEARQLFEHVMSRNVNKTYASFLVPLDSTQFHDNNFDHYKALLLAHLRHKVSHDLEDDLIVEFENFGYNGSSKSSLSNVTLVNKNMITYRINPARFSHFVPTISSEKRIYIYSRTLSRSTEDLTQFSMVKQHINQWFEDHFKMFAVHPT